MIGTPCDPDVRVSSLPSFSLEPAPRQLRFSVGGVVAVVPDISYGLVLNLDFLRSRWGLYARYREEGAAFVPKYKALLHATSVMSAEDAAAIAGIDLTDRRFWESSLESISRDIDEFLRLLEKN